MKIDRRNKIVILLSGLVFLAVGSEIRADVGSRVEIKMSANTKQAVSGQMYAGVFHVHVYGAGVLTDFKLEGEGWNVLSVTLPADGKLNPVGMLWIPFRAVPSDADKPIRLSFRHNGRLVAQEYEIGPAYFSRAGKPYKAIRVEPSGAGLAPITASPGESEGSSEPMSSSITLRVQGRIIYTRPCRDMSNPADGDCNDPEDIPAATVGVDKIDVRILDNDTVGSEEMWSGHTDQNGYFDTGVFGWEGSVGDPEPDLVVYFETETDDVDVTDNSIPEWTYTFATGEVTDWTGGTYDFGWLTVDSGLMPALHMFNSIVRTHRFIETRTGRDVPQVQIEWPDNSKGGKGAWYERDPEEIHISTEREWNNSTHTHEYGHHFVYKYATAVDPDYCNGVCDPDFPNDDCGHCMWCAETDHDAFAEGWPNWLADVVTRSYPDDYTFDVGGPPYQPLYTRSQETPQQCGTFFDNPLETEGFMGALLTDIEDNAQDDHDTDGVTDCLALGANAIFHVVDLYEPTTPLQFISAFLTEYPQFTNGLWSTAFNVHPVYVQNFPADTQGPGVVTVLDSPTHPLGIGGPTPCITVEWVRPVDDSHGVCGYSYEWTTNPGGVDPGTIMEIDGSCITSLTEQVCVPEFCAAEYYFSIRAVDCDDAGTSGIWSDQWATFGPFVLDCNANGILDMCDVGCGVTGVPGVCEVPAGSCNFTGCGTLPDCNGNLRPDGCDISLGVSEDCNLNGIPDECENMYHWDGTSGSWHSSFNWLEGSTPITNSHVCANVPGDQRVTYSLNSLQIATLACHENLAIEGASFPCTFGILNPSFVLGDLILKNNNTVLQVDDRLDIGGLFEWTGSNVTSSAKLKGTGVTYANGGVQISEVVHLEGHSLILDGNSTSVCDGRVDFVGASVFEIRPDSTYEHQGGNYFLNGWFDDSFVNGGTLIKSVNPGYSVIYMFTNNSGLIHVQAGTLKFYLGSSSTGDFLADPGTTLEFNGGNHEFLPSSSIVAETVKFTSGASGMNSISGTYNVSGSQSFSGHRTDFTPSANVINYGSDMTLAPAEVRFDAVFGGPINFNSIVMTGVLYFNSGDPINTTTLTFGPGTIRGPSTITVSGLLTWNGGGYFRGPGVVNANGGVVIGSGGSEKTLYERVFNNASTATFLGPLSLSTSGVFNNLASGVIDIQVDSGASIIGGSGIAESALNNAGTIVKSTGVGTSTISAPTTNSGTVEVQTGVLRFYTYYGS